MRNSLLIGMSFTILVRLSYVEIHCLRTFSKQPGSLCRVFLQCYVCQWLLAQSLVLCVCVRSCLPVCSVYTSIINLPIRLFLFIDKFCLWGDWWLYIYVCQGHARDTCTEYIIVTEHMIILNWILEKQGLWRREWIKVAQDILILRWYERSCGL